MIIENFIRNNIKFYRNNTKNKWSHLRDSDSGPADYKSAALPGYAKVAFGESSQYWITF